MKLIKFSFFCLVIQWIYLALYVLTKLNIFIYGILSMLILIIIACLGSIYRSMKNMRKLDIKIEELEKRMELNYLKRSWDEITHLNRLLRQKKHPIKEQETKLSAQSKCFATK